MVLIKILALFAEKRAPHILGDEAPLKNATVWQYYPPPGGLEKKKTLLLGKTPPVCGKKRRNLLPLISRREVLKKHLPF